LNHSKEEKTVSQNNTAASDRSVAVRKNSIASCDLFVATKEILIQHGEETYRLRLTGQNKLILTK